MGIKIGQYRIKIKYSKIKVDQSCIGQNICFLNCQIIFKCYFNYLFQHVLSGLTKHRIDHVRQTCVAFVFLSSLFYQGNCSVLSPGVLMDLVLLPADLQGEHGTPSPSPPCLGSKETELVLEILNFRDFKIQIIGDRMSLAFREQPVSFMQERMK